MRDVVEPPQHRTSLGPKSRGRASGFAFKTSGHSCQAFIMLKHLCRPLVRAHLTMRRLPIILTNHLDSGTVHDTHGLPDAEVCTISSQHLHESGR